MQGSKNVPAGSQGQIDFNAGQVTFKVYLRKGKGFRRVTL